METRARYVLVGLFTLAVIGVGFVFVYWLHNTSGLSARAFYRIRFESSVSGLLVGSSVLFNGLRVGEVTDLQLRPGNPREVMATIAVAPETPVRTDSHVGLVFGGLTGSAAVSLTGGAAGAPMPEGTGTGPPVLVADAEAGQDMTQAAREALQRLNKILEDNAEPLRETIGSLDIFSEALARNSDRVDTILRGLEGLTGGGPAEAPPTTYDLIAPGSFPRGVKRPSGQLAVAQPTTVVALDTQRILLQSDGGEQPAFQGSQWSDSIPLLFQARIIEGFENADFLRVGRAGPDFLADYQLLIDIRRFEISTISDPTADVRFTAKLLGADGRIVEARLFKGSVPVAAMNAGAAAAALNEAFEKTSTELVVWTLAVM